MAPPSPSHLFDDDEDLELQEDNARLLALLETNKKIAQERREERERRQREEEQERHAASLKRQSEQYRYRHRANENRRRTDLHRGIRPSLNSMNAEGRRRNREAMEAGSSQPTRAAGE